ncbi:MAG: energy transducer TonB [Azoarcus sp.]|jgi:protein TonB|nr:energy transducer TonB [Azoarcus sp.]
MANTLSLPNPFASLTLPGNRGLAYGLAGSILLHVLVLMIQFEIIDPALLRAPRLDVILVNAKSDKAPDDPQAYAQANLDGGGLNEEDVRTTSPLPVGDIAREGDELVDLTRQQQAAAPRQQNQENVLTARDGTLTVTRNESADENKKEINPQTTSGKDERDSVAMLSKAQAELDEKMRLYNQRPRKNYVSVRTQEHKYAMYFAQFRSKIERVGNMSYPVKARGLYDKLTMTVEVRKDGSIDSITIDHPSKYAILNETAERIVRFGAPYAALPPNIAQDTDVLVITTTLAFTNSKFSARLTDR